MWHQWLSQVVIIILITDHAFGHCLFNLCQHIWPIHNVASSFFTLHNSEVRPMYFTEHFLSELLRNNKLIGLEK